tara:strand:- start:4669 stop:5358 length:690 start_codon:yes stop_codon:yes gene_type:complete
MPRNNSMSRRARRSMNNRRAPQRRRTRSAQSRRSAQQRRRTRSTQQRRRTRSAHQRRRTRSAQSSRSAQSIRRPTTLLDTIGVDVPTPSFPKTFIDPNQVEPEQLVKGQFYFIKFIGIHRSEHNKFVGIYKGGDQISLSFTNMWRMVPYHMREEYTTWVHLDWDLDFDSNNTEFYPMITEYSKWVKIQKQLEKDSKLKDIMLYNTYLEVFGQGDHSRHLVEEASDVMHR